MCIGRRVMVVLLQDKKIGHIGNIIKVNNSMLFMFGIVSEYGLGQDRTGPTGKIIPFNPRLRNYNFITKIIV